MARVKSNAQLTRNKPYDPWLALCTAVIVDAAKQRDLDFFLSPLYALMLDYIRIAAPDAVPQRGRPMPRQIREMLNEPTTATQHD